MKGGGESREKTQDRFPRYISCFWGECEALLVSFHRASMDTTGNGHEALSSDVGICIVEAYLDSKMG